MLDETECPIVIPLFSKLTIVSIALPCISDIFVSNRPVQSNLRWGCDQKTAVSELDVHSV
jgi:hypothetical protein